MIEINDIKQQLKKIKEAAGGKDPDLTKAHGMLAQLHSAVIDDISSTGDQVTRTKLRLLKEFKLPESKK